jgi:hypothetical protein
VSALACHHRHSCPECEALRGCDDRACEVVHTLPHQLQPVHPPRGRVRLCEACAPEGPFPRRTPQDSRWRERGPVVHVLKTRWTYFQQVITGDKRAEMRRDDRGFRLDDVLDLREILPSGQPRLDWNGRRLFRVSHVLRPSAGFGVMPGWIMLSIRSIALRSCRGCGGMVLFPVPGEESAPCGVCGSTHPGPPALAHAEATLPPFTPAYELPR